MVTRIPLFLGCILLSAPASAQMVRLSVSTAGTQANGPSDSPGISGDGRFVVFASAADNLVAGDTNGVPDIFLRDRDMDADGVFDEVGAVATTRISVAPGGAQANSVSSDPVITPDGRFVCFVSKATNVVPGIVPEVLQVFRLDRATGAVVLVSVNDAGIAGDLHSYDPVMSDDGNVIAFTSEASTLVSGAATTTTGIFVRDVAAGHTIRITPPGPTSPINYLEPRISADGGRVLYRSSSAARTFYAAQLYERASGTTRTLDISQPMSVALSASGRLATGVSFGRLQRVPIDLGPATAETATLFVPAAVGVSPDARYVLGTSGLVTDFALASGRSLAALGSVTSAVFDRHDRWLALSTPSTVLLPAGADSNNVADVFVLDLPDLLDADDDGVDDLWESFFGAGDPSADPDGDGATNAQEFAAGTHPTAASRRYLAEGATSAFFTTDIAIANPDVLLPAKVVLTFLTGAGTRLSRLVEVLPRGSVVVHAGAVPGLETADFSTTIDSDRFVAVSRTMSWDTLPPDVANRGYGLHLETASAAPATTWFFAEGSTVLSFDLFYLLQNPAATTTHTTVRFLLPGGATVTRTYDLAPGSRTTIYVNQIAGLEETDVSGDILADAPIVAERAMYRSLPGQPFVLGHDAAGVTAAATRWFLAEGATGPFFDEYVLIANPGGADAAIEARYAKPDGSVVTRQYIVRANSRFSVFVDAIPGLEDTPVATTITSTNSVPVVVERAMYWPGGFFDYYEGHVSAGSTTTARRWVVPGGEYGGRYDSRTFVLIANTSIEPTPVSLTMLPATGETASTLASVVVPPNSRTTVEIVPQFPVPTFGVFVEGALQTSTNLVVEVAVYRTIGGVTWSAGGNALATPLP